LKWLSKCCPSKGGFEVGFSDEMSVAKAEVFLKRERECQAQYLRRKDKDDEVSTRLERAAQDTMQLREDMEKVFEVCNGRFDKLEKINHERLGSIERSLAALSHAQTASKSAAPLPSPAKSKSGTAAMSYAPSYAPSRPKLNPVKAPPSAKSGEPPHWKGGVYTKDSQRPPPALPPLPSQRPARRSPQNAVTLDL